MKDVAICVSNDNIDTSIYDTIDAIKEAGFKNVFIQWYDDDLEVDQKSQLDYVRKQGLNVIFAHLGYQGLNEIWLDTPKGEAFVSRYIKNIEDLKKEGIDMVVIHSQAKFECPEPSQIGLDRFKRICSKAKQLGVKVAIENTKRIEHLKFLMDNIKDDNVGMCIDVGHWHCNFKDKEDIKYFKDRIFAVHLHDNDSSGDQHYIPYEGSVDWPYYLNELKLANYDDYLTLESNAGHYGYKKDVKEFYKKAYEASLKLLEISNK